MLDRIPRPVQIMMILAVFALGAALGTNAMLAKVLTPSPAKLAAARSAAAPSVVADAARGGDGADVPEAPEPVLSAQAGGKKLLAHYLSPIKRRNIFDSEANPDAAPPTPGPQDPDEVTKKSEINATLISTMEAADPSWSTALIAAAGKGPAVYMIGEQILTAKIRDIKRPLKDQCARVILENNGELEYLSACDEKGKKPKAVASKAKDKKKPGGRHKYSIEDKGNGKFDIPQGDIDYVLGNLDKLGREARVVPNFADGSPNGWKVFSIRRTSALRQMGIKNNDVLTAVNGHDLSNTEKALEVYGKLQSDKSFSLEVLRNGEPMTLEYEVR
jgi:general secretion pathway protein C